MLALDHLVIAARDPKEAAEQFGKKNDVITMKGGKHENWGTYNYLAYFSNQCYIEWIGMFDKDKALRSDNPLIKELTRVLEHHDEYAYQFALRTLDMDNFVTHFKDSSISFVGPIEGSRKKPDGSNLEWRMLFPTIDSKHLQPFLIEWGKTNVIPDEQQLINQKQIQAMTYHHDELEHFVHIYKTTKTGDQIQLENTVLLSSNQITSRYTFQVD